MAMRQAAVALMLGACAGAPSAQGTACAHAGVAVDFRFEGAGRHQCLSATGAGFEITVTPENEPINPSPWYALRLTARAPAEVAVTLRYRGADHRYAPQVSRDGQTWTGLAPEAVRRDDAGDAAVIALSLPAGETFLAAQPFETPAQARAWALSALAPYGFAETPYGRSVDGRTLYAYVSQGAPSAGVIVAIARQHPPETPGAAAFRALSETLAGPQGAALRARHTVILVPMVNPDGVVAGHWRHNRAGVDLNRDWGPFSQPETRALAALIDRETRGRPLVVFLDFHATRETVIYAPPLDAASAWIDFLPMLQGIYVARLAAPPRWSHSHTPGNGVAKTWALEAHGAPGLTVEVADHASVEEAYAVGQATAQAVIAYCMAHARCR